MRLLFVLMLMGIPLTGMSFVTIGTDAACDLDANDTTIQQVIDDGEIEIRLTTQVDFVENLYVDHTTRIFGGFANCDDANNNLPTGKTVIDGNDYYSVVTVKSDGVNRPALFLSHLKLTNGNGADIAHGGGISAHDQSDAGLSVSMDHVIIAGNRAINGGGIMVSGPHILIYANDTMILNNTASQNGGGVYCDDSQIILDQNNGVSFNKAESISDLYGHGGGIFADNDCSVTVNSGSTGDLLDFRGFSNNKATGHGGGVYVGGSSYFLGQEGVIGHPVNVDNNIADWDYDGIGNGGGFYIENEGSGVYLDESKIAHNAAAWGGAVAVHDDALLSMRAPYSASCWNKGQCHLIYDNFTTKSGGRGGAIHVASSSVKITAARIYGNRADVATVINAESFSQIEIKQSTVYKNGNGGVGNWSDTYVYQILNSEFNFYHSTSVANYSHLSTIRLFNSSYAINNSILYELLVSQFSDSNGSTGVFNCVVADEISGINGATNVVLNNPQFIDTVNDDYHLSQHSPAIDLCEEIVDDPLLELKDLDNEKFGWDDPNRVNVMGTFDAGSDEAYSSDVIFKSSMES